MTGQGIIFALDQMGLLAEHQAAVIAEQAAQIETLQGLLAQHEPDA